jgi:hypothetical protein
MGDCGENVGAQDVGVRHIECDLHSGQRPLTGILDQLRPIEPPSIRLAPDRRLG